MGNQQERPDLAWAAGIIDGEGTIGLYKHYYKKLDRTYYDPLIAVVNTDPLVVAGYLVVLRASRIGHYIMRPKRLTKGNRQVYRVHTRGIKRCIKALKILSPYLVAKRKQALLLLEHLEWCLTKKQKDPLRMEKHEEYYQLLKKEKRVSSETNTLDEAVKVLMIESELNRKI